MTFDYQILLSDPSNLGGGDDALLVRDLSAALADWSTHLTGVGVLKVQLNITGASATAGELASGGPSDAVLTALSGGVMHTEPSSQYELLTGYHVSGAASDITINVPVSALSNLYLNPSPTASFTVPGNEYDATSVFRHELMHGFGMSGYLLNASLPGFAKPQTPYDADVVQAANGQAYFVGHNAEAIYGGPVPLTSNSSSENLYHLANASTDPLGSDLMNGIGVAPGRVYWISGIDLAILQDVGEPVTANAGVAPYAITATNAIQTSGVAGTITEYDFTVQRHGDLTNAVTLNYSVAGVAAGAGIVPAGPDDFAGAVYPTGGIGFAAGVNTATLRIQVAGTSVLKPSEAFAVTLDDANGAPAVSAVATILNTNASSSPLGVARDGNGVATIALQGSHDQYVISPAGYGSVTVADLVAGRDGAQTVQDAADITFSDGTGRFDATGNAETVAHLYQAAFGRAADIDGLNFWTGSLDSGAVGLDSVATAFLSAPEFGGAVSHAALVQTLYQNVLDRPADADGLAYWTNALDHGASPAAALIGFAESPENLANTVGTIGDPHAAEAARLYQAAFGRAADGNGLAYWTSALQSGATPMAVAAGFTATPEFAQAYAGLSHANLVAGLYQNVLGRTGDPSGIAYWTAQLDAGRPVGGVLLGFADSPENRSATAGTTHDGWIYLHSA